jgi:hypothetical protein
MAATRNHIIFALVLICATAPAAFAQISPDSTSAAVTSSLQPLLDFRDSDIKFSLQTMLDTLRDHRHEGWVLAAYPDPKTSRPLIGAGFSLDVPAREHAQTDPLNPNTFLEPSSSDLWQAAGLEARRLRAILDQYDRNLTVWKKKKFRKKIRTQSLTPDITEEQAMDLLRISAIQAVHNARAYCRNFDQLNGSQQMALSQLVFQMGINFEQFTQFRAAINGDPIVTPLSVGAVQTASLLEDPAPPTEAQHWSDVQGTLIHSDWARRYSTRAIAVIAMFDPAYASAPWEAEARVRAQVRPLVLHRRKRSRATIRTASAARGKNSPRRARKS